MGGYRNLTLIDISVVVEQTPEAYIQLHYISRWKQNEMIHRNANSCCMVSCLSLCPSPTPRPSCWKYNEVQNFSCLPPILVFVVLFLVLGRIRVPCESLFVEGDDHLWTLDVGLLRWHQVGFIWIFPTQSENSSSGTFQTRGDYFHFFWVSKPFHEEHEFSCGICGADDPLWNQPSSKAPQLLWLRVPKHKIRTKPKSSLFMFKRDR